LIKYGDRPLFSQGLIKKQSPQSRRKGAIAFCWLIFDQGLDLLNGNFAGVKEPRNDVHIS
jgi:hypothetical protein